MIDGVAVRPLRRIEDSRGSVMHMLRSDDAWFRGFGEIYFSTVKRGIVKGWHLHKRMWLNYAVPFGRITFALYDDREGSRSKGELQELALGGENYALVTVPPGVWNGFLGESEQPAVVANCATEAHDPEEIVRLDPFKNHIPYGWKGAKDGG